MKTLTTHFVTLFLQFFTGAMGGGGRRRLSGHILLGPLSSEFSQNIFVPGPGLVLSESDFLWLFPIKFVTLGNYSILIYAVTSIQKQIQAQSTETVRRIKASMRHVFRHFSSFTNIPKINQLLPWTTPLSSSQVRTLENDIIEHVEKLAIFVGHCNLPTISVDDWRNQFIMRVTM